MKMNFKGRAMRIHAFNWSISRNVQRKFFIVRRQKIRTRHHPKPVESQNHRTRVNSLLDYRWSNASLVTTLTLQFAVSVACSLLKKQDKIPTKVSLQRFTIFFFWVFLLLHLASKPWLFTATATAAMLPAAGDAAASSVGFCSCFYVENGGSYDDYIDGSGNRGCMHCKRSDPSSSSSCYSCSSLWLDLAPFKDSEKLQRVITASAKGFSIGAGLKGGLALFSILTRLRRRQSSAFSR